MGRHSDSDVEDYRKSSRKKKKKRSSRSRSKSSESPSYSRSKPKKSKKSKHKRRSRSHSPKESSYSRSRRSRSRSRSRRGRSRSRSRERRYKSRSRSRERRSRSRERRSRSRERRSRSLSRSRDRRSRSQDRISRSRDRRSRSRDRRSRSRERRDGSGSRRSSRSPSKRYSSKDDFKSDLANPYLQVPGYENLTAVQQAEIRMQFALKAAAAADERLKAQGLIKLKSSASNSPTVTDQLDRVKAIEDIEAGGFSQKAFKATRFSQRSSPTTDAMSHENAIFGTGSLNTVTHRPNITYQESDTLLHPSFYQPEEVKMEKWMKKLAFMRRRKLEGAAMS